MKAVILAAGRGTRMGNITKSLPKCLLKFGNKTIIEMQIEILNKNGINDITVVTGFKKDLVHSLLKDRVKYVINNIYDQSNSSYSLYLAKEELENGWLHMNCDLVFSPGILGKVLKKENENSIVVDLNIKPMDDQEKVRIEENIVVEMSKTMPFKNAHGKTIGMARFSEAGAKVVLEHLDSVVKNGEKNRWFFSIISDVLDRVKFRAMPTDSNFWAEIDTPEDLSYARKLLLSKYK